MRDKDLFELFMNKTSDFHLCEKVEALIDERIKHATAMENVKFYDVLRKLSDSINNAGWEDRHSQQIDLINKASHDIVDKYEEYLP